MSEQAGTIGGFGGVTDGLEPVEKEEIIRSVRNGSLIDEDKEIADEFDLGREDFDEVDEVEDLCVDEDEDEFDGEIEDDFDVEIEVGDHEESENECEIEEDDID